MKKLILLTLILVGCANQESTGLKPTPNFDNKIVAFGDSHTYGTSGQQLSWPDQVTKALGMLRTGINYSSQMNTWFYLDNQAMGSTKFDSPHQHGRMMSYAFKSSDTVVMMLGFNDVVFNGLDPAKLENFKTLLDEALTKIETQTKKVFVGNCIKVPISTYDFMTQNGIEAGVDISHGSREACDVYAQAVRDVVALHPSSTLVDTNANFDMTENDFADHVHFKFGKHLEIANLFIAAINK